MGWSFVLLQPAKLGFSLVQLTLEVRPSWDVVLCPGPLDLAPQVVDFSLHIFPVNHFTIPLCCCDRSYQSPASCCLAGCQMFYILTCLLNFVKNAPKTPQIYLGCLWLELLAYLPPQLEDFGVRSHEGCVCRPRLLGDCDRARVLTGGIFGSLEPA